VQRLAIEMDAMPTFSAVRNCASVTLRLGSTLLAATAGLHVTVSTLLLFSAIKSIISELAAAQCLIIIDNILMCIKLPIIA